MPEQMAARVPERLRRMMGPLVCVLPLCGIPGAVFAQSVPPGLRACAADADSARRLACYDREMASLLGRPAPPPKAELASSSAPAQAPQAAVATSAPPRPASQEAPPHHRASVWKFFTGSSRMTAHIASLDRWPDAMVLHLDNGQVWQQVGRASGDLSLQVGDSVTIEKHLGSYWLSSLHVSDMQVRLKPQ